MDEAKLYVCLQPTVLIAMKFYSKTGDVILSRKPGTWGDFFDRLKTVEIPKDFMSEREDSLPQERDF